MRVVLPVRKLFIGAVVVAGLGAASAPAQADGRFGPHDVQTLFVIGKNTDKNEVQFGIHLDKECVPIGDEPIYPYWRQYEKGPEVTEDLNFLDRTGYGIKSQRVESRGAAGSKVALVLKATPERGIGVYVRKDGSTCAAETVAFIGGVSARLQRIHVQLKSFLSIDYIDIRGTRVDDDRPVSERAKP